MPMDGTVVNFLGHLDENRGSPQSLHLFISGRTR